MGAIWFLLGIVVGAAVVWFLLQRLSDRRVAETEARVERELDHARTQARDADLAHAETKERLIALQARTRELEATLERERAELTAARERLVQLEARAATLAEAQTRLERAEAELARLRAAPTGPAAPGAPAATAAPPAPAAPTGPSEELRRLDARLAMLPAGSSARALLLKQRAELVARADRPPAPRTAPPPAAPPPEPPAARAPAAPDDLKLIKGIGPVLERRLHELGVRSFADLAALTPERVKEIDEAIEFPGRIERERWIEQAKEFLRSRS